MNRDIFLSYSHADLPAARLVVRELERRGFHCWFAARDLQPGLPPLQCFSSGLQGSRVGIVLGTSAAESSSQVLRELEWLVINDRPVILLQLKSTPVSGLLGELLAQTTSLDFSGSGTVAEWQQLVALLQRAGLEPGERRQMFPRLASLEGLGWSLPESRRLRLAAALLFCLIGTLGVFRLWATATPDNRLVGSGEADSAFKHISPVINAESLVRVEELPTNLPAQLRNSLGMKFALVPPGSFTRRSSLQPTESFTVSLTKPYYLGVTEVTQQQFRELMGVSAGLVKSGDLLPADSVTWFQAVEFCQRLSELPAEREAGRTYRLPTESEWEFAARAGSGKRYFFGDDVSSLDQFAWLYENSQNQTQAVGIKLPNPWGLYDVYGNVTEWCSDWLDEYPAAGATDPLGPATGEQKVLRGGGFLDRQSLTHSGWRQYSHPEHHRGGMRVLCEVTVPGFGEQSESPPSWKRLDGPFADSPIMSKGDRYRMENKFDR